ncbi:unnamed protein product [Gadus morhua 'NCC']
MVRPGDHLWPYFQLPPPPQTGGKTSPHMRDRRFHARLPCMACHAVHDDCPEDHHCCSVPPQGGPHPGQLQGAAGGYGPAPALRLLVETTGNLLNAAKETSTKTCPESKERH